MAKTPEQPPPQETTPRAPVGYTVGSSLDLARMPFPGNAEFAVFFLVWAFVTLIWIIDDQFEVSGYVPSTIALTIGYLISRGIAKASRVLEH